MRTAFSVRLTPDRFEKLRGIAHAERVSMNEVLNRLVDSVPTKRQVVEVYDLGAATLGKRPARLEDRPALAR